jgi:hypothetical protein
LLVAIQSGALAVSLALAAVVSVCEKYLKSIR